MDVPAWLALVAGAVLCLAAPLAVMAASGGVIAPLVFLKTAPFALIGAGLVFLAGRRPWKGKWGGGKSAGMQIFLDKYGFNRSESMAFGDGENDKEMLEYAGIGVAMGNAKDSVKAVADYVTDSVDDNGIENALRHFGLIR